MVTSDGNMQNGVRVAHAITYTEAPNVRRHYPADEYFQLRWRHNGHDGVSNQQPHYCLLNRMFVCR